MFDSKINQRSFNILLVSYFLLTNWAEFLAQEPKRYALVSEAMASLKFLSSNHIVHAYRTAEIFQTALKLFFVPYASCSFHSSDLVCLFPGFLKLFLGYISLGILHFLSNRVWSFSQPDVN